MSAKRPSLFARLFRRTPKTIRRPKPSNRAHLGLTALEVRDCPAAVLSAYLSGSTLMVEGTEAADYIRVDVSGSTLSAAGRAFNLYAVNRIVINGLGGNDAIYNNTSTASTIYGGTGADTMYGGNGADILAGESGNDYLYGRNGTDTLYGNDGDDRMWGGLNNDVMYGGWGNDIMAGEGNDDFISGDGGSDTLYGNDGNDTIYGDESWNSWGGTGNDILYGGAGNDTMAGQGGNDYLRGEQGADTLYGNDGHDTMYGDNAGNPWGGEMGDVMYGGAGNDTMAGEGGNDYLRGEGGTDVLYGNDGDDILYGDNAGNPWGNEATDHLFGGWGYDWLYGEGGNDYLYGEGGGDNLYGGTGADNLYGGEGNDGLFGGIGWVDVLNSGPGYDRFLQTDYYDQMDVQSPSAIDVVLKFNNGGNTSISGTDYTGQNWTDGEIVQIDEVLNVLHHATGSPRLLVGSYGLGHQFHRHGTTERGYNDGYIHLTDGQFNGGDQWLRGYVLHEIGHSFHGATTYPVGLEGWAAVSGWTDSDPEDAAYSISLGQDVDDADDNWWYYGTAVFASDYARTNPNEDFAESFSAYFTSVAFLYNRDGADWTFYNGAGAVAIPEKMTYFSHWVADLSY